MDLGHCYRRTLRTFLRPHTVADDSVNAIGLGVTSPIGRLHFHVNQFRKAPFHWGFTSPSRRITSLPSQLTRSPIRNPSNLVNRTHYEVFSAIGNKYSLFRTGAGTGCRCSWEQIAESNRRPQLPTPSACSVAGTDFSICTAQFRMKPRRSSHLRRQMKDLACLRELKYNGCLT